MKNLSAIILAAGKGTRMKSSIPKVLHGVTGRPMLFYPVNLLKELKAKKIIAVVGHGAGDVRAAFASDKIDFVTQKEQLGTGHAVLTASKALKGFTGDILILSGDVPLITKGTINALIKLHRSNKERPALTFVSTILPDPKGYGRVVRDDSNIVSRIVEHKDATASEKNINEVNCGLYLFDAAFLLKNIKKLGIENAQGEYYLPDLVSMAVKEGRRIKALTHIDPDEVMGINNRIELARANSIMRQRILESLMLEGVTIVDPASTYIDYGVSVGVDTVVYPGAHLIGSTAIGSNCVIEEGVRIEDSAVGDGSVIKSYTVIESTRAGMHVTIGPFARLRPGNVIEDRVRIGNFVEVKKSTIGKGTKANHLTYIGDSVVGREVNIGAGTITCNYDGIRKYTTTIEDNAFIGSDSQLVAPVKVGKGAYVGSGTTVTKDVPPGALIITRANERVIEGWAERRMKKGKKGK